MSFAGTGDDLASSLRSATNALKEAHENGLASKTAEASLNLFNKAIEKGHGDEDFSAIISAMRKS